MTPNHPDALILPHLLDQPGEALEAAQTRWRKALSETIYGPLPPPPDRLEITRHALKGERAERMVITLNVAGQSFTVDAALWLPPDTSTPCPLIAGLDFIGPAGVMSGDAFPLDPRATILPRPEYGARDKRLTPVLRGTSQRQWPVDLLTAQGYAVLLSCYGSWVPDDADRWTDHGLAPLLQAEATDTRAISLWAWAILRLLDAAQLCGEIDADTMVIAGHSRLGKSALWAAAHDTRIKAVFAAHSGCAGAAPTRQPVGETSAELVQTFPHWTRTGWAEIAPDDLPIDQHALLGSIAPRGVYLAAAEDDLWANPLGSYAALQAAAPLWLDQRDPPQDWPSAADVLQDHRQVLQTGTGFHLRPGGHDLIPYDWRGFLTFLTQLRR